MEVTMNDTITKTCKSFCATLFPPATTSRKRRSVPAMLRRMDCRRTDPWYDWALAAGTGGVVRGFSGTSLWSWRITSERRTR